MPSALSLQSSLLGLVSALGLAGLPQILGKVGRGAIQAARSVFRGARGLPGKIGGRPCGKYKIACRNRLSALKAVAAGGRASSQPVRRTGLH